MANMRDRLQGHGYGGEGSRYRRSIARVLADNDDAAREPEPDQVAEAFRRALTEEHPRRRYLVVPNQREAEITIRAALARVVQLNAEQPFAYDRDALVRMLDEALAHK